MVPAQGSQAHNKPYLFKLESVGVPDKKKVIRSKHKVKNQEIRILCNFYLKNSEGKNFQLHFIDVFSELKEHEVMVLIPLHFFLKF